MNKLFPMMIAALVASAVTVFAAEPVKHDPALEQKIKQSIQQLGDKDWKKRDAASEELRRIGQPALPQLTEALKSPDAEVRHRAGVLITGFREKTEGNADAIKNAIATFRHAIDQLNGKEGGSLIIEGNGGVTIMGGGGGIITVAANGAVSIMDADGIVDADAKGEMTVTPNDNLDADAARAKVAKVRQLVAQVLAHPILATIVNNGGAGGAISSDDEGGILIADHAQGEIFEFEADGSPVVDLLHSNDVAKSPSSFGVKLGVSAKGLHVKYVHAGSRAEKAGLQVGDRITKVGAKEKIKFEEVEDLLTKPEADKPLKLEVVRKNETITLTVPEK